MAPPPPPPVVFRTFRCSHCTNRDRLLRSTPESGIMLQLPDDVIQVPEGIVSILGEDNKPFPILVSMESGALRAFVYGEALIKNASTRQNHNKGFPRYKGPKVGQKQDWYAMDKDLFERLRANPGDLNAPSAGSKAALRLDVLKAEVEEKLQAISEYFYRARAEFDVPSDRETIKRAVKDMLWRLKDIGGDDEVHSLIRDCATEHLMTLNHEPQSSMTKANDLNMDSVVKKSEEVFGLTEEESKEFNDKQGNGERVDLSYRLVGRRNRDYSFVLPNGKPWDFYLPNTNSSDTHMSSLKRMVFMAQEIDEEYSSRFFGAFTDEEKETLGCSLPYFKSEECIDAMAFLEQGFYTATLHIACVPCRKTKEAICEGAKGSLVQALKAYARHCDKYLIEKIEALDLAWERFFAKAKSTFYLVQQNKSEKKDIPSAWEMLHILYDLDHGEKSPITLLLRAFIGIAFFCGLRSSEIAKVRTTFFSPPNTGCYLTLVPHKDNPKILILKCSKNKTMENGLKTVEFPPWLSEWVREYEEKGRPALGNPTHSGLFVTKTGQPLCPKDILGTKSKKAANDEVIKMLFDTFPGRGKQMTCFTDLRGIFFQTNSVHITGSMMNIFANARDFVQKKKRKACNKFLKDLDLPEAEDLKYGMAKLNASSKEQADKSYNEKTLHSIEFTTGWYDAAKRFAWHALSTGQDFKEDAIAQYKN